jgi:membrane-associated HD superfamily phosphohydrolase
VENQVGMENKHENLSPHMSSLIIISHVKDGVEIAKSQNLPKSLTDIIPQHHGTRLINYFFHKAKDQENKKNQEIKEEDFRYPGPKPKTKEAAIMMLADAVEAASRTLSNPTPARLKGLVKKIFDDIFLDGQLDECDLTLKDLDKISSCFMRILTGIYHQRIDYPNFAFDGKGKAVAQDGNHREKLPEKVPPGQK